MGSTIDAGVAGVANAQLPSGGSPPAQPGAGPAAPPPPPAKRRVTLAAYFLLTTSPDAVVQLAHTVATHSTVSKFDKELKSAGAQPLRHPAYLVGR